MQDFYQVVDCWVQWRKSGFTGGGAIKISCHNTHTRSLIPTHRGGGDVRGKFLVFLHEFFLAHAACGVSTTSYDKYAQCSEVNCQG